MRKGLWKGGEGRLPSLGQDFERGHQTYVEHLDQVERSWLRTKPFSAPPSEELTLCLRTFAHVVEHLGLGLRAQVLDVGCGPGWLSEFLARCGYRVTGIDISEDMVEIARERVAAIETPSGDESEPIGEFHAMPVREMPWRERFDAAILYDTMHHFDDELETLRVIHRTLCPGGWLYVREGARPKPGSEEERDLIAEMEQYGTLESPFDPDYLVQVVREAGFGDVRCYLEVDQLFDLGDATEARRTFAEYVSYRVGLRSPPTNVLLAAKPMETGHDEASFSASFEAEGPWRRSTDGRSLRLSLRVQNVGRCFWPTGRFPFREGAVTIAPYLPTETGGRTELPRTILPRAMPPGDELKIEVTVPADAAAGSPEIAVDCVREGLAWFSDLGSSPLLAPISNE